MNDIEARIIKLENSYNSLKEKIEDIKNSINNSLEKLFLSMKKIQKNIESFNHIALKQTIQKQTLIQIEKNYITLSEKIRDIERRFNEHNIKQKTSLKVIAVLFTTINLIIGILGKIYAK